MRFLAYFSLLISQLTFASGLIADNLVVREIIGSSAVLEGKTKSLKAGDKVYYGRPPFQFTVESVKENQVTIHLADAPDLKVGSILLLEATDAIKKSIMTESRLKEALGE